MFGRVLFTAAKNAGRNNYDICSAVVNRINLSHKQPNCFLNQFESMPVAVSGSQPQLLRLGLSVTNSFFYCDRLLILRSYPTKFESENACAIYCFKLTFR